VTETESYYYLVVNNSSKIEVVSKNDFKSVATIEGFSSPRCFLDLENGKALVSNFIYDTSSVDVNLDIVNLSSNTIEGHIVVNNWCETMLLKGETVLVANTGMDRILLIDRNTLTVKSFVNTPKQPYQMLEDKNGKVWVLCKGDVFNGVPASIICLSASGTEITGKIEFITGAPPEKIALNSKNNVLYILSDKMYKMSVSDPTFSLSLIPGITGFTYAYGLGVDPVTDDIYIGDAKDFVSNGTVKVFDFEGALLKSYEAGVNPNGFVFR
jgi:DNA-binding beta-propeller fold protein YncE